MRRVIRKVVGALRPHSSLLVLAFIAASATTYVACVGDDAYVPGEDGATDTKPSNDAPDDTTDDSPVTTH